MMTQTDSAQWLWEVAFQRADKRGPPCGFREVIEAETAVEARRIVEARYSIRRVLEVTRVQEGAMRSWR